MTIYYLMIKTHNITGLKYLCQTRKINPIKYTGSGKEWSKHLARFGSSFSTEILLTTSDWGELKSAGRFYSRYYNIVTAMDDYGNKIWANLIPETGGGSGSHHKGKKRTLEQCQKIRNNTPLRYGPDHPGTDLTIYKWTNVHTHEIINATRQEFIKLTNASPGNIVSHFKGERRWVNGWINDQAVPYRGAKNTGLRGKDHARYDHYEYVWINSELNLIEKMTRHELITKYKLHSGRISDLVHNKIKSSKGWTILR